MNALDECHLGAQNSIASLRRLLQRNVEAKGLRVIELHDRWW